VIRRIGEPIASALSQQSGWRTDRN